MIHDWQRQPGKTYYDMVLDYAERHGLGKNYPIISRKDHPNEWREWTDYFRFRKLLFSLDQMRDRSTQTVPCLSPVDFDPEYRQPLLDRRYGDL